MSPDGSHEDLTSSCILPGYGDYVLEVFTTIDPARVKGEPATHTPVAGSLYLQHLLVYRSILVIFPANNSVADVGCAPIHEDVTAGAFFEVMSV